MPKNRKINLIVKTIADQHETSKKSSANNIMVFNTSYLPHHLWNCFVALVEHWLSSPIDSPSPHHIITSSHHHIITSSHLTSRIFVLDSRLLIFGQFKHLTTARLHNCTPSQLYNFTTSPFHSPLSSLEWV